MPAGQLDDVILLADDGLDEDERRRLLAAIDESLEQADAGDVEDFTALVAGMRARQ